MTAQQMSDVDLSAFDGHTPGPWQTEADQCSGESEMIFADRADGIGVYVIVEQVGGEIHRGPDGRFNDMREVRANTALIQHAPELLAECKAQRAELERLRAEREGLRKRIERVEQLIGLTLNTIPKDCGGICTCNRCEIMREVQAALAATHADEAKGE